MAARLAHGDLALDAKIDFLAVVGHRLIPTQVPSEWARLKSKGENGWQLIKLHISF